MAWMAEVRTAWHKLWWGSPLAVSPYGRLRCWENMQGHAIVSLNRKSEDKSGITPWILLTIHSGEHLLQKKDFSLDSTSEFHIISMLRIKPATHKFLQDKPHPNHSSLRSGARQRLFPATDVLHFLRSSIQSNWIKKKKK